MNSLSQALKILKETSRTFYIPITFLPKCLQEAVISAYLCMRAIDEIEDHSEIDNLSKTKILRNISLILQGGVDGFADDAFLLCFKNYKNSLAEVTLQIRQWTMLAPETIAPRIWDATAAMADRMAYWSENNWEIHDESDLDRYTFSVAGTVGLLLSDLWAWYDGTKTNRSQAIGFGRGLQAVNILRNRSEDLARGVDFFPQDWNLEDMQSYARRNLKLADTYNKSLPAGPALDFCQIPLILAYGTLDAIANGKEKLNRSDVIAMVKQVKKIES